MSEPVGLVLDIGSVSITAETGSFLDQQAIRLGLSDSGKLEETAGT